MKKKKILVSACLLGELVRHNAQALPSLPERLKQWQEQGLLIPVCPEVAGGLPVPRPPAEIQEGDGEDVIKGFAKVLDINGQDVTGDFLKGAQVVLQLAEENQVECAVLKAYSPSCGGKTIYDGSFSGKLKTGQGVTTALLESNGIEVFNEDEIEEIPARFYAKIGSR
jgi:uncharacterized protein YbbK (DUF523 family)